MSEKIEVILVDIGSSSIKSAEVINGDISPSRTWDSLRELADSYPEHPLAISSVQKNEPELCQLFPDAFILNSHTKLPITLNYDTPETLGPDRIALAVGAYYLFPGENNLICDLGTCMTIDFVDKDGVFQGGIISPGLTMRMKAMSHYTKSLPDISSEWNDLKERREGKTTRESLLNGSLTGLDRELNSVIETFRGDFTSLNVILTGGDSHFFESRIKAHIFAGSKIVQTGLYRIWNYQ